MIIDSWLDFVKVIMRLWVKMGFLFFFKNGERGFGR